MYYATPTDLFRQAGISTVIWANHLMRSSITAMRDTARTIPDDQSLHEVEGRVASVKDIFALIGNDELEAAERRYLPATPLRPRHRAGRLRGRSRRATADRAEMHGRRARQAAAAAAARHAGRSGVRGRTVVRGYRKEASPAGGITVVDNDGYAETGEVASLACAMPQLEGETVVAYGDVLFRRYILDDLLDLGRRHHGRGRFQPHAPSANPRDLVTANAPQC